MKELLKDEYDDYISSFNRPSYKALRINTSKISVKDFLERFPFELEPVPWTSDGFYYSYEAVTRHPWYYAGLFYIQEASAMLPGEMLPIEEGDVVLDACAAPGGKSLKILDRLDGTGLLMSNDISATRANALLRNIERQGFSNYFVSVADLKDLEKKYTGTFDKILLDAPCSGEGMFRKEPSLIKSWMERNSEYYAPLQKELIISAVNMLKEGGILLYSTCTFDPKEDEEVIEHALEHFKDLRLLPIKRYEGFREGNKGIGVKLFPHLIKGEGHFVCLLQKGNKTKKEYIKKEIPVPDDDLFSNIRKRFYNGSFKIIKDKMYFVPGFDTQSVRILRSGLFIGDITRNGIRPSQSLAMSLKNSEFANTVELDQERAVRYLKGETVKTDQNNKGLALICLDSHPLGFGKTGNGQIKNMIDKGWTIH